MHISHSQRKSKAQYNYGRQARSQNSKQSRATAYGSSQCHTQQLSQINNYLSIENKKLAHKYEKQNELTSNLLEYYRHNADYHEGLKHRNALLNNTLTALMTSKLVLTNQAEVAHHRNAQDKDDLLRCCNMQFNQLTHTKRMISSLMDSKSLLQSRMQTIGFELQQQIDANGLQSHEMAVRAQGMHINMMNALQGKNKIIQDMQKTIDAYDKQNKDLKQRIQQFKLMKLEVQLNNQYGRTKNNNQNKAITQEEKQQYMNRIIELEKVAQQLRQYTQHLQDSIGDLNRVVANKDRQISQLQGVIKQKQEEEENRRALLKQAQRKRPLNKQQEEQNQQNKQDRNIEQEQNIVETKINSNFIIFELSKGQGLVSSVISLRNGINREIFEIFITSIERSDQAKTNSLSIFLQRWKTIEIQRIQPYVKAYMEARTALLKYYQSHKQHPSTPDHQQLLLKIKQTLPILFQEQKPSQLPHDLTYKAPPVYKTYASELHKKNAQNRSKINVWILNTIQFTINQREVADKNTKSELLYLFRMLTIQYRVTYPMKGQQYVIDADVRNCLLDHTVQAVWNVIQIK